jgi:pimeloyl-ACP methyl ester carboxylesterase
VLNLQKLTLLALFPACTANDPVDQSSFVIVHGAWNGAWAWRAIKADLVARGATVTTVELPAHGGDMTPLAEVSLRAYVDTVEAAIAAAPKPVTLVGHSFGGVVVTEAADERAADLDRLIYVTAFVPKTGDSLLSLSMQDPDSELGAALAIQMEQGTAAVMNDRLTEVFCADCDAAAAAELHAKYRDEPLGPFVETATVGPAWTTVPKFYVFADDDHAISPLNQAQMTAGIAWKATASLPTSHSPFLSQPTELTEQLAKFVAE